MIGSDLLWPLIILAGFLFFTALVPLPPNDYWWHLRIGEVIFTESRIPSTNLYAWTLPADQPFFYAAWLGELLLYLTHRVGGLELNIFLRTVLAGLTYALVMIEARRHSASWRIAALLLALACMMSTNNLIVRTQMYAWLPFMVMFTLLSRYADGQLRPVWLAVCPLGMLAWVNLHGSFVLGLGLMGIFLIGETLRRILKAEGALSRHRLGWLAGATAATFLATLVNPRFTGIIGYVRGLLGNQPVQQFIQEWQPPTPDGLANSIFFASILLLILALAISRARFTPTQILLVLALLWLAWSGQRSVAWYAMAVLPLSGKLLRGIPLRLPALPAQRKWINNVLVIALCLPVLLVQPWFVQSFPLPATYWAQVQNDSRVGPLMDTHTPIGAAEYLQQHPGGRLFNELGYGSYLIWAVPDQGVFIDPRIELYPVNLWEDYIDISRGVRAIELLEAYQVERVLLDTSLQSELLSLLENNPEWHLEYKDEISQVWALK